MCWQCCCILLNKLFLLSQLVAAASRCHKCFCSEMRFTECMSLEPVSFWKLLNGCSLHEQTKGKVISQHLESDLCPMMPNK